MFGPFWGGSWGGFNGFHRHHHNHFWGSRPWGGCGPFGCGRGFWPGTGRRWW